VSKFGEIDYTDPVAAEMAAYRVTALLKGRPIHRMHPIDAITTENPNIIEAEWYTCVGRREYIIRSGFIALWRGEAYHAKTFNDALSWLTKMRVGGSARLKPLLHRMDYFSRSAARTLGWCNEGINDWVRFLPEVVRNNIVNDTIPVDKLAEHIGSLVWRDHYEEKLWELLHDHPIVTGARKMTRTDKPIDQLRELVERECPTTESA
jgi:hypothetical protein